MKIIFYGTVEEVIGELQPVWVKGDKGEPGTSVVIRSFTDLAQAQAAAIQYPNDIVAYKPIGD